MRGCMDGQTNTATQHIEAPLPKRLQDFGEKAIQKELPPEAVVLEVSTRVTSQCAIGFREAVPRSIFATFCSGHWPGRMPHLRLKYVRDQAPDLDRA